MRVIGGTARGCRLASVPGDSTRPIMDRVKTALFDILRPSIVGVSVLDCFAGTGAVGIEALSQGAGHCTFLDLEKRAIETIKSNLTAARLSELADVRHTDAFRFVKNCQRTFGLIYVAPPQYEGIWLEMLRMLAERPERLTPEGQIVVQIDPSEYEPQEFSNLTLSDERKYGNTLLLFYSPKFEAKA